MQRKTKIESTGEVINVKMSDLGKVMGVGINTKVFSWVISNVGEGNYFLAKQKAIAEELGMSDKTVGSAFKKLRNANFLRAMAPGVYMVNPDILCVTNNEKERLRLCGIYEKLKK